MKLGLICFTRNGGKIGELICEGLKKNGHSCIGYINPKMAEGSSLLPLDTSLHDWCEDMFSSMDGIIFVSACGIAVRGIAPFIKHKTKDPAVVVIDELGHYCISLLSGHIGGGNSLTKEIASLSGATPIISTATDLNHKFAVDEFAVRNQMYINSMDTAKLISSAILEGKKIGLVSDFPLPKGVPSELEVITQSELNDILTYDKVPMDLGICISFDTTRNPFKNTLSLVPKIISLGIGCKKDTPMENIETLVLDTLQKNHMSIHCVSTVASINLKSKEPGLLDFCNKYNITFHTYSTKELLSLEGDFSSSSFVKSITGVSNVCERASVLASNHGQLLIKKTANNGVTLALSISDWRIRFE